MGSMQMYVHFKKTMLEHSEKMLEKFPSCLKIAFIDHEDKGVTANIDRVSDKQSRRWFSSLIDKNCGYVAGTKFRKARLRVELPGFPLLGDGKGDNQNHAIIFMRGMYNQCIDA